MHRNDHPTAPGGHHRAGDPARGTPATVFTADLAEALQEEMAHVIEAFLGPLVKADNYQLKEAIEKVVGTTISNTLTTGEYVTRPELGSAAYKNVGTSAAQVAAGNHDHADLAMKNELGNAAYKDVGQGANQVAAGDHTHAALAGSALPIGVPIPWPTGTPPVDYLMMAGQAFSPFIYPALALVYPGQVLPDLRGEFIRGWDNGRGVDPGRALLSGQADEFESHSHQIETYNTGAIIGNAGRVATAGRPEAPYTLPGVAVGGAETRPRNVSFLYICRAR